MLSLLISLSIAGCANSEEMSNKQSAGEEKEVAESVKETQETETETAGDEITLTIDTGNTSGNIQNGGIAAVYGDTVFYSDSKNLISSPKDAINEMDKTGEILDSVEDGLGTITSINVINDRVYYVKNEKIFAMDLDGEGKEEIPTSVPVSNMIVYKDHIIFSSYDDGFDANSLFTMETDGGNLQVKASSMMNFYVEQGKLYWSEKVKEQDYRIYITDLESGEETVTSHGELESLFQVSGGDLYYLEQGDLYKMSFGGDARNLTANMKQSGATIDMPNISGETIYFTEDQKMFAMDLIGSKHWEVPTGSVYAYSIAGGHLFYWGFGQGEYSLGISPNVEKVYDQTMEAYENSQEATEGWGIPDELFGLYDEVSSLEEPISLAELEEKETAIMGGEIVFPQQHLVGATKVLLWGLANKDEEFLKTILTKPDQLNSYFNEPLRYTALEGKPYGGYYEFKITVRSDSTVYIEREEDGWSKSAVFEEIDGNYYFDKFLR